MSPKKVHATLKTLADAIRQAAAKNSYTERHYDRMVAAIREEEKAHQRLRPISCPREISFSQAVNYFIVRCTCDALNHPNQTATDLSGVREDYVWAALMVACDRTAFETSVSVEMRDITDTYSYPTMKEEVSR